MNTDGNDCIISYNFENKEEEGLQWGDYILATNNLDIIEIIGIFDFNKHYFYKEISPTTSDFFDEIIDSIEDNGIDMTMDYQSYRGELKIKPEHNWKFFDSEIGRLFVSYLKNNGYDGAFFTEEGSPIYVVFNSNQIKSVENDGTWDVVDDNIYS